MIRKTGKFTVIPAKQHQLSIDNISPNALKVVEGLAKAGFDSYLVGGCVRDALLGMTPKDFDVSTDATPEQVKRVFRNARIIGRRFRIVHVRMGREIIEVTTFRGQASDSNQQVESDTGQLIVDNVYGDMESDAMRRDFTINALYYDVADGSIYDYTQGVSDIDNRLVRMIGDPITRYREDPVRLLRAVRFMAKLGFSAAPETAAPIRDNTQLLHHVAPARLFDEVLKLFMNGSATATFSLLREYGLLDALFPGTMAVINKSPYFSALIEAVMLNTDKRIRNEKRVTPAFIYGALLWPAFIYQQHKLSTQKIPTIPAVHQAADAVIAQQLPIIAIPKRFQVPMRQIWELQWRLTQRRGRKAERTLEHEKFRAGYDFLLMREAAGEKLHGLGQWWTRYQELDETGRQAMVEALPTTNNKKASKKK